MTLIPGKLICRASAAERGARRSSSVREMMRVIMGSFTQGFAQSVSDSLAQDHRVEDVVVTGTQTPRTLKKLPIITRIISHTERRVP